jgi:pimeloyl-ACP methyl ester carboxylesterase
MSAVILQNEIVHYEVLGRGRPLICLHSWAGSWRYWIPTMQAASIACRAYAIDLWGFGDTAKASAYYGLEQQAELLEGFMNEMGMGRIALLGHGLGAIVALLFAARQPKLVDRVMVVGLPHTGEAVNPRLLTTAPADLADWLLGRSNTTEAARAEVPKADFRAIQNSLADFSADSLPGLFEGLTTPCLLVHGQNDPVVETPETEFVAGLPENVHPLIFEQCGHYPMLDEPSKFHRLLADFLDLKSGESPSDLQLKEEWKRRVR